MKEIGADVVFNYKTTKTSEVLAKEGPIDVYATFSVHREHGLLIVFQILGQRGWRNARSCTGSCGAVRPLHRESAETLSCGLSLRVFQECGMISTYNGAPYPITVSRL